jgi:small subunit ribosomal protein S18
MENNNSEKNKANNKENRNNNSSWKRQTSYKRKECPIESGAVTVDYKDSRALQKFTSERGKVLPRRISSVSSRGQRKLVVAIKRARYLALLPYVAD